MPVEFCPKDDRTHQGHPGPHFQVPIVGSGNDKADDEIMFLNTNVMMMNVICLVVFGTHKNKFVATLSPGCFNMRCLHYYYYFTFSLCHFHLGFMIVGAGHDPAEYPDFLCNPLSFLLF